MSEHPLKLTVNGRAHEVRVEPHWTLQRVLLYKLGLPGSAKTFCDHGECGACTVIMDGRPVLSCVTLAIECEGKSIETIEGIAAAGHPLIHAYMKWDAAQCGYCTPGFIVTAKALLDRNPDPTEEEVRQALAGNLCRCGTYPRHTKAVMEAAEEQLMGLASRNCWTSAAPPPAKPAEPPPQEREGTDKRGQSRD